MSDISKNIIEKIKKECIKPTPKWVFLLKNSVIWGIFAFSILLGSIAVSIIIFQLNDVDWNVYHQTEHGVAEFVILAVPYFWVLLMGGFLYLAHHYFYHTKAGYRYSVFLVFGLSLVTSAVIGSGFYASGFSEKMEELFVKIPHYEMLHYGKRVLWQRPHSGFLSGTILQIDNGAVLILQDFRSQPWWVDILEAKMHHDMMLQEGLKIKMIGERMAEGKFKADMISPWYRTKRLQQLHCLQTGCHINERK